MGSRRGRLNWSNLDVRISDDVIEKQHRFTASNLSPTTSTLPEDVTNDEKKASPLTVSVKRSWVPKTDVGEILAEQFVGNFMLTDAEQTIIDQKYKKTMHNDQKSNKQTHNDQKYNKRIQNVQRYNQEAHNDQKYNKQIDDVNCSNSSPPTPKPIRISSRLPATRDTVLSPRMSNLYVGQHLLNVFVCHVESYSHVYIMFGDDYNRATKLFQDMNNCIELIRPSTITFELKEQDLVALYHEKKWFRGRCLNSTGTSVTVLCIDSGVNISCSRNNLRRLPDMFRTSPPCCIECSLSGLPTTITMNETPDAIRSECIELLYKDRYEAIVTKLESPNHPTIVLYYGDENVNDRLYTLLKLI